ncbi:MAG: hypothetical protein K8F91_26135, partial [Candidatus Obscuribacterales bacterium]|nr:hypothetical protein [Candidatus Obscuribacterales bacterium]
MLQLSRTLHLTLVLALLAITQIGCSSTSDTDSGALPGKTVLNRGDDGVSSIFDELDKSRTSTRTAETEKPESFKKCIALAASAIDQNDCDSAIKYSSMAIKIKPYDYAGYFFRGKAGYQIIIYRSDQKASQKVIADLEKAVSLKPDLGDGFEMLANLYVEKKDKKRTILALNRALELMPTDRSLYEFRAAILS